MDHFHVYGNLIFGFFLKIDCVHQKWINLNLNHFTTLDLIEKLCNNCADINYLFATVMNFMKTSIKNNLNESITRKVYFSNIK